MSAINQDMQDTLTEAADEVNEALDGNGDLIDTATRLADLVHEYFGPRGTP